MSDELAKRLYREMQYIRQFEQSLLSLFAQGKLSGTTHSYIGQEAIAASVIGHLHEDDIVISNHRCHGHYLAKTKDGLGLLAEIMGREGGVCEGKGGSQHLKAPGFMSSGVQGNLFPVAAGLAYANKLDNNGRLITVFIGDGTLGQGVVYETLNLLGLLDLPILIVVENNGYAQTTPVSANLSGDITSRFTAFGLSCHRQKAEDPVALHGYFEQKIAHIRQSGKAHVEVLDTYRLGPHSKGDDFRDEQELALWWERDPLAQLARKLPADWCKSCDLEIQSQIEKLVEQVEQLPLVGEA